jgi:RNA polymerase sigma-70 factor (ECF subfamily)
MSTRSAWGTGDSPYSDEELLTRLLAGDEEAFTALYHRRQGRIYRFALEMSGSEAVAEEVVQEVFLAVLNGDLKYDSGRGRLSALLMGVARNQVLRLLRKESRYAPDVAETDHPAGGQDALASLAHRESVGQLKQAVLSLPPNYREVVALCDLEEVDYAEAAEVLGCPIGTVRSRLHRARAMLTEKLRPSIPVSESTRSWA